ncbi:TetR/AcrR family transcriptional regulator C-terminal domain-containing protein [Sciscionella sediminilitoris]|uniref:TetR/AcrR family transcriptional regulator C-terminal domain-containing protein n=1 Tax=Sciscionella sediminilitoris TaxID=1445613 RepID=UPI0004DF6C90|nr:TetR/AcrR family transcriptional regulator C-terminal domain-containing protein [Sciscionella sp. SE31]
MTTPRGDGELIWLTEPADRAGEQLSRERIVAAAMAIADEDPRGEVTMRAIATRIGTRSPMALYRYVRSKDGLADLMNDEVFGQLEIPRGQGWRACLRGLGHSASAALERHPWWARLAFSRPPLGPNALAVYDGCLAELDELGLDAATRMGCISIVFGQVYSTGLAALEERAMRARIGVQSEEQLADLARPYLDRITEEGAHPHFIAWANDPGRLAPPPQDFARTLEWLLDGLERDYAGG